MATFWVEEESTSDLAASTLSHMESKVTIKSRMRKSTVQLFNPSPRSSNTSVHLHRKSSPPLTRKTSNVLPSPFVTSTHRSSTVSMPRVASTQTKLGRTWSTISEPPGADYDITVHQKGEYPLKFR